VQAQRRRSSAARGAPRDARLRGAMPMPRFALCVDTASTAARAQRSYRYGRVMRTFTTRACCAMRCCRYATLLLRLLPHYAIAASFFAEATLIPLRTYACASWPTCLPLRLPSPPRHFDFDMLLLPL